MGDSGDGTMKTGTGDDPFESSDDGADAEGKSTTGSQSEESNGTPVEKVSVVDEIPFADNTVPKKLLRDTVKGSRDVEVLLALYSETDVLLNDARSVLDMAFDEGMSKMDQHEILLIAGMMNLDDAYDIAETWGYGYEE